MNNILKEIQLAKDLNDYMNLYSSYNELKYLYNITLICKLNSNGNKDIDKENINQIIKTAKDYGFNFNYCMSFDELSTQLYIANLNVKKSMSEMINRKIVDKSLEIIIHN